MEIKRNMIGLKPERSILISRRGFFLGAASLAFSSFGHAHAQSFPEATIRIASNQGIENATIQRLMADCGYANNLNLNLELISRSEISGPLEALVEDKADICMVSAYAGVLPAIERGEPVRVIGTAMQLPAVAVYSARPNLRRIEDLAGCKVGIGGKQGLLHIMMIALLQKRGVDPSSVQFVSIGSNADVLKAVIDGRVDAGPSGIAGFSDAEKVHVLSGGRMWRDLAEFTYQTAYASLHALKQRPEVVARCLAAYTKLFRFMSHSKSERAYLRARQEVGGDSREGEQVWDFIHHVHPYPSEPGISAKQVEFLQKLNVICGLQKSVMPFQSVADPAPAMRAHQILHMN